MAYALRILMLLGKGSYMSVGFKLGSITDEVGTSDFLYSFFSTISGNLEPKGWGTRFPCLLNKLYQGNLNKMDALNALAELNIIDQGLAVLSPDKVIWDFDDRSRNPPWGNNISPDITNLSNYFVTSTGNTLIPIIRECLEELHSEGGELRIVSY